MSTSLHPCNRCGQVVYWSPRWGWCHAKPGAWAYCPARWSGKAGAGERMVGLVDPDSPSRRDSSA